MNDAQIDTVLIALMRIAEALEKSNELARQAIVQRRGIVRAQERIADALEKANTIADAAIEQRSQMAMQPLAVRVV